MNTSLTKVDSVSAIITINVSKADYQENYDNAIKSFRKKANVPGFRPGTVPTGMVRKMYGKSILAEEVNKLVGEALYGYIKENNLDILGEPMVNEEKQQPIDFAIEGDYDFFFDIALAPEINLELSAGDKVPYYNIDIDEELVDRQINAYKSNYGKYETVDEGSVATDLIKGNVAELEGGNVKDGGIAVDSGVIMASYMKDEAEQNKFVGVKPGDVVVFNPGKAYDGNETEIASLLKIQKTDVEAIAPEFRFEVAEVTRYKEADMDQELFDKIFGKDSVASEDEFRTKVKESISQQFTPDSDYKFLIDARELLSGKIGDIQFPDAFLKRWLLTTGKERTAESLEADYPKIIEDLKFHLIKEHISKTYELKLEDVDVKAIAMQAARAQFAQYGMMGLPDEMIENYANDMLKNQESSRNLVDRAMESKIISCLKEKLGVEEKSVSLDEFRKFFETEAGSEEATEETAE